MLLGYARVSKTEERGGTRIDTQVDGLRRAGAERIEQDDGISGAVRLERRPAWQKLMDYARPGDTVLMSEVSRLSRDTLNGLQTVAELRERGIGVKFLSGLDCSAENPDAELALTVELAIATRTRQGISANTLAGLKRARERGEVLGRRPAMTPDKESRAAEMLAAGASAKRTAETIGVSVPTLRQWRRSREAT